MVSRGYYRTVERVRVKVGTSPLGLVPKYSVKSRDKYKNLLQFK